jgi:hypothetical protein
MIIIILFFYIVIIIMPSHHMHCIVQIIMHRFILIIDRFLRYLFIAFIRNV